MGNTEGGVWKLLFTLELDVTEGCWTLGGFMCFFWPNDFTEQRYRATRALMAASNVSIEDSGLPDMEAINKFIWYANLRSMVDNKGTAALCLETSQQLTREQMQEVIRTADREQLKFWREKAAFRVPFGAGNRLPPRAKGKRK